MIRRSDIDDEVYWSALGTNVKTRVLTSPFLMYSAFFCFLFLFFTIYQLIPVANSQFVFIPPVVDDEYNRQQFEGAENDTSMRGLKWDGAELRKVRDDNKKNFSMTPDLNLSPSIDSSEVTPNHSSTWSVIWIAMDSGSTKY